MPRSSDPRPRATVRELLSFVVAFLDASTGTPWRLVSVLFFALFLFVGAGVGFGSGHACACPAMEGHHGDEQASASHEDETATPSCACGSENPSDCQCEFRPDVPSATLDAIVWTAPLSVAALSATPHVPAPTAHTEGFAPDTPPGNWLYGRPPPVSIYLLHRTLLI